MEDLSTLERIQRALDSGQIKQFHYHDHELALRHQAKVVRDVVAAWEKRPGRSAA
jgi:hypothetical protein